MELSLWHCLCAPAGGRRPRLQIPEVCVFRGSELDGWYFTKPNGQIGRRKGSTREEVLDSFRAHAAESPPRSGSQADAPLAILRKPALRLPGDPTPFSLPQAELLTEQGLREVMARVESGDIKEDLAGPWCLQSVVEPLEDSRVVSVYSCDAWGVERSDVFVRSYHKAYALKGQISIPEPEDLAADKCMDTPKVYSNQLEAATLAIVRHLIRVQKAGLEGLILEFVFDQERRPVLHSFNGISYLNPEVHKRLAYGRWPVESNSDQRQPLLKAFPVPLVTPAVVMQSPEELDESLASGKLQAQEDGGQLETEMEPHDMSGTSTLLSPSGSAGGHQGRAFLNTRQSNSSPQRSSRSPGGRSQRSSRNSTNLSGSRERRVIVELEQVLKSPQEQVLGAELSTHWGMVENGHMSAHILAAQIEQRMGRCKGRICRSTLMTQLASQLSQYHELELAWRDRLKQGEDEVKQAEASIQHCRNECVRLREALVRDEQAADESLAKEFQKLCAAVDDQRSRDQDLTGMVSKTAEQLQEQKVLVQRALEDNEALDVSMAKTIQKLDEVSAEYTQLLQKPDAIPDANEIAAKRAAEEAALANNPLWQVPRLKKELQTEAASIHDLREKLRLLRERIPDERSHVGRLEAFVAKLAAETQPSFRIGGGYIFDNTVQMKAREVLKELSSMRRCQGMLTDGTVTLTSPCKAEDAG